ncbi:uncharacterized protein LOC123659692 [Melitaea cinxia]|uniref:uncharacterized protein LOC123659692 n=1 Tax=Melitaea cinxia TaxID=113334 RepID=UPI001E26F43A|nr:uncharacterized protein LOC123659692 [Melitaea cinxia]
MFKLVVLCAFLAAAVAEPSGLFAPLAYSTSVISPASTTITRQASSVIHPSPVIYSAPWSYNAHFAHLIKKRSVLAPASYIAPASFVTSYAAGPLSTSYTYSPYTYSPALPLTTTYSAPIYSATAHFIKKRSAVILPSTYVAPRYTVATSYVPTTYAAPAHIFSTPFVSSAPIAYSHLIKKRSAPFAITTYSAPAAFSHQSRIDIKSSPAFASYSYPLPLAYSGPVLLHK